MTRKETRCKKFQNHIRYLSIRADCMMIVTNIMLHKGTIKILNIPNMYQR